MSRKKVQHPSCPVIPLHMQRHLAEHGDDERTAVVAMAAVPLVPET